MDWIDWNIPENKGTWQVGAWKEELSMAHAAVMPSGCWIPTE